jgi:phenylacetate-CoA ligase
MTAFRNPAMPLIRYDTGDLAQAVDGPCACGRTLPSFGEIAGRYRRFAGLPDHTRDRVRVLQRAFARCPLEELLVVRQFQIHQHRDQHFELRLQTTGPIPESLRQHFLRAWSEAAIEPLVALELRRVDGVCRSPGGKVLDFTSDLYPDNAAAGPPWHPAAGVDPCCLEPWRRCPDEPESSWLLDAGVIQPENERVVCAM